MYQRFIEEKEIARLTKLRAQCPETDEDLQALAKIFDEDSDTEIHDAEPEQSLELLTGGERYIQD